MRSTDPISDYLTRIRNGHIAKHDRVDVPLSKIKVEFSRILRDEGYIGNYSVVDGDEGKVIRIFLRYDRDGTPAIRRLARVSRPGRRVYRRVSHIRPVLNGLGVGVISTSSGLMTDQQAREHGIGGEVLCEIW